MSLYSELNEERKARMPKAKSTPKTTAATLPLHIWTPNGRVETPTSAQSYRLEVINHMQDMVRESGYNLIRLMAETPDRGYAYSRAHNLYTMACQDLKKFAGLEYAEEFVSKSYQPLSNEADRERWGKR